MPAGLSLRSVSSMARTLVLSAGVLALLVASVMAEGTPLRRRPYGNSQASRTAKLKSQEAQAQAEVAAEQRTLQGINAAGANAQQRLGSAQSKIGEAASTLTSVKQQIDAADDHLREIEKDLEAQQPATSDFAKALKRYSTALGKMQSARSRVLNSPEYKKAHEAANVATDRATALAHLQSDALDDDKGYKDAKWEFDQADTELSQLRQKLYTSDPQWKQVSTELAAAKKDLKQAESTIGGTGLHKMSAGADLREAQAAANTMNALLAQSQARLKAIQSQLGNKASKPPAAKPASASGKK